MDIVDSQVRLPCLLVMVHILGASTFGGVGHCVRCGPSIDDDVRRRSTIYRSA